MSQPTRVDSWSELLLALPEFELIDARIDRSVDELCAQVRLPRASRRARRAG